MAQVRFFKFDIDGFQVEHNPATDDLTALSLAAGAGGISTGGDVAMGGNKITGLADGALATDAVTKGQLDTLAFGFDRKASVRVRSSAALAWTAAGSGIGKTLTSPTNTVGENTQDGVLLLLGDRVLVDDGTADTSAGIYTVTQLANGTTLPAILTRATDADADTEFTAGMFTFVSEGTIDADTGWFVVTNDPITVDTTAVQFTQFAGVGTFSGGNGIDITSGVVTVDLTATPGLEFAAGLIQVLVNPTGAIERVAAGIGLILEAANPSLQIVGNEAGVKFSATTSALQKTASGLGVLVDGASITINGSNQLVASSSAAHTQDTQTAAVAIAKGDPVFPSANDNVSPIDNTSNNTRKYVGVAQVAATATNPVIIQMDGILSAVTVAGTPAAGDIIYANTPNGLTDVIPTASGSHRLAVGKMINATDLVIEPQYLGKLA